MSFSLDKRLAKQDGGYLVGGIMSELVFYKAIYIKHCVICEKPYVSNLPPGKGTLICDSVACYIENQRNPFIYNTARPIEQPKPTRKPSPNTRIIPPELRKRIFERDKHKCRYCGKQADCIDHVIPWSRGGSSLKPGNLVAACNRCNSRFHNKLFKSFKDKKTWLRGNYCIRAQDEVFDQFEE